MTSCRETERERERFRREAPPRLVIEMLFLPLNVVLMIVRVWNLAVPNEPTPTRAIRALDVFELG